MNITTQSATIAELMKALATVQGKIDNVTQDREVEVQMKDRATGAKKGTYKFRYATLAGILHHIRDAMAENGVWYTQFIRAGQMVTRLYHQSGEWMDTGDLPMPDIKGNPQDIGSIISYFKRYSLTAALGLAAEEDTDAEQGDREVSFKALRAKPREEAPEQSGGPAVEEPEEGWGDWARAFIETIRGVTSEDDLDMMKSDNKRLINAIRRHDKTMYDDIGNAFTARRSVISDNAPI